MSLIWLQVRAELRAHWPSAVGLALMVALAGGAILGALAGAHRTATAYDRMVVATRGADVMPNPNNGTDSALQLQDLAALPQVEQAARADGVIFLPPEPSTIEEIEEFPSAMASDGASGYDLARPNVLEGRMPDPNEPYEILVGSRTARQHGLHAGDTFPIRALSGVDLGRLFEVYEDPEKVRTLQDDPTFGQVVDLEVVGVGVMPEDLILEGGLLSPDIIMTPAYWEKYDHPSAGWWGSTVRLKNGADDLQAFEEATQALVPDEGIAFQTRAATSEKVARTVRPYVVALLGFAAVATLLGLLVIEQAVSRRSRSAAADQRVLQALGLPRTGRFGASLSGLVIPVVGGGIGAIALAWLISPIAPLGPVRDAEPDSGLVFQTSILLAAGIAFVLVILAIGAIPIWRSTRVQTRLAPPRPSRAAQGMAAANAPATGVIGVRFALESGGDLASVPTRTVLIGASSAVALGVAMLTFGASLNHFLDTPRLFGSPWNVIVDGGFDSESNPDTPAQVATALDSIPEVEAHALVEVSESVIGGRRIPTVTFNPSSRPVAPTITEGRQPVGDSELAVGRATAAELGLEPGDRVTLTDPDGGDHPFTLTGIAVLPEVGTYPGSDKTSLGHGVLLGPEAFHAVTEDFDKHFVVARVSGADPAGVVQPALPTFDNQSWLSATPAPLPSEVTNLARLRSTPNLLLGMLLVLLGAAVVHALLVAFRARRHDVAILQALGYRPRQVITTSLWQATTTAVVAIVLGVPDRAHRRSIGLEAAHPQGLAAVADPTMPVVAWLALMAVAVLVLVNGSGCPRLAGQPPLPGDRTEDRVTACSAHPIHSRRD